VVAEGPRRCHSGHIATTATATCAIAPHDIAVRVEATVRGAIVRVVGEFDMATAPFIGGQVGAAVAAGARHLVIDLAGVTFMDSSGLHVLDDAIAATSARAGSVTVVGAQPPVARLLGIAGRDLRCAVRSAA
jgi:anti-sigma B factor antagonist